MNKQTKICPYCSEEIFATAIKCKHCHTMLTDSSYMQTQEPTTATSLAFSSKYDIIEKIGSGGMANVYKAKQKSLGRLVALKVFHQSMMQDTELFERFQREARICATLKHPNIVNVYDIGYENGYHFISMEYISGINLHQLIRKKSKLDPGETIKIVLSIAAALDYAHSKGIIHRDIKSSNILISDEGEIYLADFGIAHAAYESKITLPQEAMGTPEYMSPEQIEMEELDGRSDYYSLGVVMYECLTGHVPFSSANPLLVLDKIRTSNTPDVSKELPELDDNIVLTNLNLLDKNKENRISSLREIKETIGMKYFTDHDKYDFSIIRNPHLILEEPNQLNSNVTSNDSQETHINNSQNLIYPEISRYLKDFYEDLSKKFLVKDTNFEKQYSSLKKIDSWLGPRDIDKVDQARIRAYKLMDIIAQCHTYLPFCGFKIQFLFEPELIIPNFKVYELFKADRYSKSHIVLLQDYNFINVYKHSGSRGSDFLIFKNEKIFFGCPVVVEWWTLGGNRFNRDNLKSRDKIWDKFSQSIKEIFLVHN